MCYVLCCFFMSLQELLNGILISFKESKSIHTYIHDVSICYQIINRPGEEIAATDGAEHVLNGACDLHRSISIYKKRALKT